MTLTSNLSKKSKQNGFEKKKDEFKQLKSLEIIKKPSLSSFP